MDNLITGIKKEWRVAIMAIWMIGVVGYLIYLNGVMQSIRQTAIKLSSDLDSVESILISTDNNVSEIKKQINDMAAKVTIIQQRARRR